MRHFLDNRNTLGLLFMLPAGVLLVLFLTYPLGLGTWLGFTDAKIGRTGHWIGIENFQFLIGDSVARLSLFNTLFYTIVASVLKFVLGLWLALILNRHLPFKSFIRGDRAAAVHRADGALRNRVLVDLRFPVLGRELDAREDGPDRPVHRFPGRALARAALGDRGEHLAGRPVRGDFPAGGAADHPAVPVRGILDRRRDALAAVLERHAAAAHADHRRGDDLLGAVYVYRLPAYLRAHARRAAQTPRT